MGVAAGDAWTAWIHTCGLNLKPKRTERLNDGIDTCGQLF